MILKSFCRYCLKADFTSCKPSSAALFCRDVDIGITSGNVELLKLVGCGSFRYDGCGLTDLERASCKIKNYQKHKQDQLELHGCGKDE